MTYKLPEPFYKEWSAYTVAEVQETADAAYAAGLAEGQAIMPMLAGKDEEYWGTVYPNGKPQPSQPAPQTAEERIADLHGVIVALRQELREETADETDPIGDYADANRPSYAEKFGEPAGANPAPQARMTDADIAELYFSITHQRLERLASPDSWVHKFARAIESRRKFCEGVKS